MTKFLDNLKDRIAYAWRIAVIKRDYAKVERRLRSLPKGTKLKVAFLVSEVAKWKGQRVYELMAQSQRFDPFIALMELTRNYKMPIEDLKKMAAEKTEYFASRGMRVVDIWKYGTKNTVSAKELDADIVFYQQPWDLPKNMKPFAVAKRALTYYFPYYTPDGWDLKLQLGHKLFHFLYRYIVCNRVTAEMYKQSERNFIGGYATKYLPLGHPTLDEIPYDENPNSKGCVIYAPHWSICYGDTNPPIKYSTFLENGRMILGYAKQHPEVKWAFKPHPELRLVLVNSGAWTRAEVDEYYNEWERIGEACYTGEGDYLKLFSKSRAMITDCSSFLTEYGCTGKPIIHLISSKYNGGAHPAVGKLYDYYYNAHNEAEMLSMFDQVIIRGEDLLGSQRRGELKAANLTGHNVAESIINSILNDKDILI